MKLANTPSAFASWSRATLPLGSRGGGSPRVELTDGSGLRLRRMNLQQVVHVGARHHNEEPTFGEMLVGVFARLEAVTHAARIARGVVQVLERPNEERMHPLLFERLRQARVCPFRGAENVLGHGLDRVHRLCD